MTQVTTTTTTLTIGIDLGDRFSHFCVLDAEGEVLEEGRLGTTPAAFEQRFCGIPPTRIAIEAGTHSPWVCAQLKEASHEVLVANPGKLRLIYKSDNKTDRFDAEKLARVARMDPRLLSPIQHREETVRADLAVLRARNCLVASRTQLVNHVRGALAVSRVGTNVPPAFGARLPRCSTKSFSQKTAEQIPEPLRVAMMPLLEMIELLTVRIARYESSMLQLAEERYPATELLRQVNGVGPVTSLAFVLTLQDCERFRDSRSVGAYIGLRPKSDQSGERNPELRITRAGDRDLRCLLVQSAQYILGPFGKDSDLRRFGLALAARGSKVAKRKAVVAVARKLAVLLHCLWRSGEVYEPLRNADRHARPKAALAN